MDMAEMVEQKPTWCLDSSMALYKRPLSSRIKGALAGQTVNQPAFGYEAGEAPWPGWSYFSYSGNCSTMRFPTARRISSPPKTLIQFVGMSFRSLSRSPFEMMKWVA